MSLIGASTGVPAPQGLGGRVSCPHCASACSDENIGVGADARRLSLVTARVSLHPGEITGVRAEGRGQASMHQRGPANATFDPDSGEAVHRSNRTLARGSRPAPLGQHLKKIPKDDSCRPGGAL